LSNYAARNQPPASNPLLHRERIGNCQSRSKDTSKKRFEDKKRRGRRIRNEKKEKEKEKEKERERERERREKKRKRKKRSRK